MRAKTAQNAVEINVMKPHADATTPKIDGSQRNPKESPEYIRDQARWHPQNNAAEFLSGLENSTGNSRN
jgi:hypothetical protein